MPSTPHTRVLIIGYVWPEPRSSAAGGHMMQIIESFLQEGWHITFSSPAGDGVLLELAADEESALRHLRLALPEIADAVRRAGLRVVRCRLNRLLHAPDGVHS